VGGPLPPPAPEATADRIQSWFEPQFEAIRHAVNEEQWLIALILTYAAIDALAWLNRRMDALDVARADFVAWVSMYMLAAGSELSNVTAVDLYAARCAILHSQVAEAKLTRDGDAVEVWYRTKPKEAFVPIHGVQCRVPILVDPRDLIGAAVAGYRAFLAKVQSDADTFERVALRGRLSLEVVEIEPPISPTGA